MAIYPVAPVATAEQAAAASAAAAAINTSGLVRQLTLTRSPEYSSVSYDIPAFPSLWV